MLVGKIKVSTASEYDAAVALTSHTAESMKTVEAYKANEIAYENILLSISGDTKTGKVAFNLVDNCVTADQPDGNSKLAWERLVHKYAPKTIPSYIQLKKGVCK